MAFYNEIKEALVKNEVYKKVKDYFKNKSDLKAYFEVGRLIVEAQDGEARAKYGNKLIKEYSERLTKEHGKGYTERNLRNMRSFYIKFKKWHTLCAELSWSHYKLLLPINDESEYKYYIYIASKLNLSVRELRKRIKLKEYERIGQNVDFEESKVNTLIKNPILIKVKNKNEKLTEYALHQAILENMEEFLKELGVGFAFIGSEVKIKLGDRYNYAEYIGQITKYINYVDKNIKKTFHEGTVGVIICKKDNKYVMEYCTNPNIFTSTYQTI